MADADQIFAEIDTDNDGYVSVAELKAYRDKTRSVSESAAARYVKLLDKDNDDRISREEFAQSFLGRPNS